MAGWLLTLGLIGPLGPALSQIALSAGANLQLDCEYQNADLDLQREDRDSHAAPFVLLMGAGGSVELNRWELLPANFYSEEHRQRKCAQEPNLCDFSRRVSCGSGVTANGGSSALTVICPVLKPQYEQVLGADVLQTAGRTLIFSLAKPSATEMRGGDPESQTKQDGDSAQDQSQGWVRPGQHNPNEELPTEASREILVGTVDELRLPLSGQGGPVYTPRAPLVCVVKRF